MSQPSISHADRDALLLSIAYAENLYSSTRGKQELLHLLVSCHQIDKKNSVLTCNERIELLNLLVKTSYDCQKYAKVIEYGRKLLTLPISLAMEVDTLCDIGLACNDIGQCKKALDYHERQLKISKGLGDPWGEQRACCNLGLVYNNIGQYKKALDYHERDFKISKQLGDRLGEGRACCNLGLVYNNIGQYNKALDYHERDFKISKELGDLGGEGKACDNLGLVYKNIGQYKKALDYYERHLTISKELGDPCGMGKACSSLGNVYNGIGQYKKALDYHEKHFQISKKLRDLRGEGGACCNLGLVYNNLGQYEKALDNHERHFKISKELGDRGGEGRACRNFGNVCCTIGQYKKALDYHERDLKISQELGDPAGQGAAYCNLGVVLLLYKEIGQYKKALDYFERYLEISKGLGDTLGMAKAYHNLGATYYMLGQYDISCRNSCQSVAILDSLRRHFNKHDQFNISIASQYFKAHRVLMACLLKLKHIKKALLVLDFGRSKALHDLLSINSSRMNDSPLEEYPIKWIEEIPSMINIPEKDSRAHITENICRSLHDGSLILFDFDMNGDLRIWVLTQQETYFRTWSTSRSTAKKVLKYIVQKVSSGSGERYSKLSLPDNRDALRKRNTRMLRQLPEFENKASFENSEISENLDLDNELKKCDETQEDPQQLRDNANNQIRDASPTPRKVTDQEKRYYLRGAYKALIAPVEDLLTGSKLIIVPDDILFCLPFSALVDNNGKYFGDHYSMQFTPALHTLNFSLNVAPKLLGPALFVGNPNVGEVWLNGMVHDIGPLYGADVEASECAKHFAVEALLNEDASKEAVMKRIKNASIVHIAAHGNMDYAEILLAPNPEAPSPAEEQHYLLTPEDISKCTLSARLVVLSCCHSGCGEISSEGVVGTARSFLGAGSRAVLVALWRLPDKETLEFMKLFYEYICNGRSVCVALQEAMKKSKAENECLENCMGTISDIW